MNFTVQNKEKISRKLGLLIFIACLLFLSTPGFAQQRICDQPPGQRVRLIQSFGHRSTALVGPVATKEDFVALFSQEKFLNNFREVLRQACLENYESEILSAIRGGQLGETTITSGTEMRWVAGRRGGRVKVNGPSRYVGTKPAEAFEWTVKLGDNNYRFAAPKVCGNILLLDVAAVPAPPPPTPPSPPTPPPPAPAPVCVLTMTTVETGRCTTIELRSDVAGTLEFQRDGAAVTSVEVPGRLNANEAVSLRLCEEGHYTARLTAENGAVCDAATDIIREGGAYGPFVSGFFGKERRITEGFIGNCDALIGIQGGYGFMVSDNWEIAPAVGVKINTEESDFTSIFADLEFNYHFEHGLVGFGVGVWDITEEETRDGSILGQFGIHLHQGDTARVTWLNQGRIFFDELDNISDNYMVWTGLRFQFAID